MESIPHKKLRILGFPNPSGSRYWRLEDPFKYLNRSGDFECRMADGPITQEMLDWADIYVLQNIVDKMGIAECYRMQQEHGKKIVVECDDWIEDLDPTNPYKKEHDRYDAKFVITRTMEIADMVTVTNDKLAEKYSKFNKNIAVLPNYVDLERWDLKKYQNDSDRIRIGWAGSITHVEDLKMIVPDLTRISKEFPNVDIVVMGETRIAELMPECRVDTVLGVPFDAYPSRLHGLRLDIVIAPLRKTEFNECKTPIKLYEYGMAGFPGVYSPTVYQEQLQTSYKKLGLIGYSDTIESWPSWYKQIKRLVVDPKLRKEIADNNYNYVKTRKSLAKNIWRWDDCYRQLFNPDKLTTN